MKLYVKEQNLFFTSDAHFCHANILKYDKRPFKHVDEMNEEIIENWNSKVGDDDIVFYLGDLSFDKDGRKTREIVHRLNGEIHYILGNHDREKDIRKLDRFKTVSDYMHLTVVDADGNRGEQGIIMSHYPMLTWDKAHHGNFMLHGHEHGSLMQNPAYDWYYKFKVLDVGCNMHDYSPLSYQEIKDYMKDKEMVQHH